MFLCLPAVLHGPADARCDDQAPTLQTCVAQCACGAGSAPWSGSARARWCKGCPSTARHVWPEGAAVAASEASLALLQH